MEHRRDNSDLSGTEGADLETFFALSADMLCIAGYDGYFKLVNPAWERTLGWTTQELTSQPWSEFVHPDDLESTLVEAANQTEQGLETISFENRYRAKDGSYRWLLWNSRPCPERNEMLAVARDVTGQREAREALLNLNSSLERQVAERTLFAEERARQAEAAQEQLRLNAQQAASGAERMRSFLEQMPLAIAVVDREMKYLFVSERFKTEYNLTPENARDLRHSDVFPNDGEKWQQVLDRCLAGETQQGDEEPFVLRGGAIEWLRWRADPWAAPARDMRGMVVYSEIVTARKQAEERLRQVADDLARSNADLEAFTYSVSHDLKEPLRSIEAFSQFLLEDYSAALDDQGQEYLRKLASGSARMKRLIEDLLALSRIGKRNEMTSSVDVTRVIGDVLQGMRASIDAGSVDVQIEPHLPFVQGDAPRLEQIFGNLIANGIKFNHSSAPKIAVGVREQTDELVTLYVKDNGIGIDPQYHERVFGIFQRLHRREEFEGTGAGLAIVKRAVETLGGRTWIESDGLDGTTFLFTLKLPMVDSATLAA